MTRPSKLLSKLPSALGYHMPAEWEPHASTWLAWPHFHGDWPGKFEPIPWVYAEIIRNLARYERVDLIVNSERAERNARAVLEKADVHSDNIEIGTDSMGLCRDHPQSGSVRARRSDRQQRARGEKREGGPGEGGRALRQH